MKKQIILALLMLMACAAPALAQQEGKANEWKIRKDEQRKTFILSRMKLNETEKAAFVPLYDSYKNEQRTYGRQRREAMKQVNDSASAEVIEKGLDARDRINFEQAEAESRFYKEMKKVLPPAKILRYYNADRAFNKLMMKDMKPKEKVEGKKEKK